MTNEEAIRIATGLRTDFKCESDTMVDFCNTIIKALKQESILEKIRTEIGKLEYLNIDDGSDGYDKYIEQYEVLKIIDKYKAESEGT